MRGGTELEFALQALLVLGHELVQQKVGEGVGNRVNRVAALGTSEIRGTFIQGDSKKRNTFDREYLKDGSTKFIVLFIKLFSIAI